MDHMQHRRSPSLFTEWAAVAAISGVLERRCWITTNEGQLFGNVFVWLVGWPASGKGLSIGPIRDLWRGLKKVRVAPNSITGKGLVDEMVDGVGDLDTKTGIWHEKYSALACAVTEFGTFLQEYDKSLCNILTDLYDCLPNFEDRTRGGGLVTIEKPYLMMLAGMTPGYLSSSFPPEAFDMGFTSRAVFVWSSEVKKTSVFRKAERTSGVSWDALLSDLDRIASIRGEFEFTPEAQAIIEEWNDGGMVPVPTHPRLQHYCGRRMAHVLKLCMIMSASESSLRVITDDHALEAIDLLLRTEAVMPNMFRAMVASEHLNSMHEIQLGLSQLARQAPGGALQREAITMYLFSRMEPYRVIQTIKVLEESGIITEHIPGEWLVRDVSAD